MIHLDREHAERVILTRNNLGTNLATFADGKWSLCIGVVKRQPFKMNPKQKQMKRHALVMVYNNLQCRC